MQKIKSGDTVIVITGKDKGKTGQVNRFVGDRVFVEGVNLATKHVKPNPTKNETGGINKIAMSIHISNVAIYNAESQKKDKVAFVIGEQGKLMRVYKSTAKSI